MKYIFSLLAFFTPLVIYASINNSFQLISALYSVVTSLIPITAGIALIVFLWGLGRFVYNAGSEKGHEEGKRLMFWGIIAIFILFSIWGIIFYIGSNLGMVGSGSGGGGGSVGSVGGVGGGGSGSYTVGGGLDSSGDCQNQRDGSLHWADFLGGHKNCY